MIKTVSLQQLVATLDDRRQILEIIDRVKGGAVGAQNPGHEIYRNRTAPFLPDAPAGHEYHEYRVGGATMPADGWRPGTGLPGQRRLVLLLREYERYGVEAAWVRPSGPPVAGAATAAWTRIEIGDNDALRWLNQALDDNEWGGTVATPAPPEFAVPDADQQYRQILHRSFTRSIPQHVATPGIFPGVPRVPGFYDLLVLLELEDRIDVNGKYYTSEHYDSWVEIH
jgi:hypothetical protein